MNLYFESKLKASVAKARKARRVQKAMRLARNGTEAQFQKSVIQAAQALGWKVAHFRPGMNKRGRWMTAVSGDGAGFPDLVMAKKETGDLIFAELKAEKGRLSPAQVEWFDALCGGPRYRAMNRAYVWYPSDWPEIEARLKR